MLTESISLATFIIGVSRRPLPHPNTLFPFVFSHNFSLVSLFSCQPYLFLSRWWRLPMTCLKILEYIIFQELGPGKFINTQLSTLPWNKTYPQIHQCRTSIALIQQEVHNHTHWQVTFLKIPTPLTTKKANSQ